MKHVVRIVHLSSYLLDFMGQAAVVAMVLVVLVAICLRWLRITSTGSYEIIVLLGTITFLVPWAYTEVQKRHIRVNILVSRLPQRAQSVIDNITYFLSLGGCYILIRYSLSYASMLAASGRVVSYALPMPVSIIMYFVAGIATMFGLVVLIGLVDSLARSVKK